MKLGKLQKVDLRASWKHEAKDFTQWLAEPENLKELGDEIGLNIVLEKTEASVGRFNIDILGQDETTEERIVIENQLETTDHSHLGQILTYAAGIEAKYIIWIVKEARDEHKQAVDWLNEHSDEDINLFLIRIELWQIGDSDPAPKFNIISKPNNWTKIIRGSNAELSRTKLIQLEFWQQFRAYAEKINPPLLLNEPNARYWYNYRIGRPDSFVSLSIFTADNKIGCELYIPDSKQLFYKLFSEKESIERELGYSDIQWKELPAKKASRIRVVHDFDFENQNRTEAFNWLVQSASKFKAVFQGK